MKGDFSRQTFDRRSHYAGVRWQQGRPVTDADENEAHDIAAYRVETEARDVIGQTGAPRENPGFELSVDNQGDLTIGAGHLYVDGILCENDEPVAYPLQADLPDPPDLSSLLSDAPLGLVYLEVFKRHLTHHDRDGMRDVALNGVDTTSRLQTTWQVRVVPLESLKVPQAAREQMVDLAQKIAQITKQLSEVTNPDQRQKLIRERKDLRRQLEALAAENGLSCAGDFPEWDQATALPTGTLEVSTVPGEEAEEPCDVPPGGGYQRGENQYYIVEVHSVPANSRRNGATFKWSRDNGSIVARIQAVGSSTSGSASGTVFSVDSVQRDDYLGIHNQDWVEYVDDTTELNGQPGILARATEVDKNLNRITLDRSLTVNLDANPKLRKWDQSGSSATDTGVAMNTANTQSVALEGGIEVSFKSGTYRPGDYWQFDARAVTGKISFPDSPQPPDGIRRHYTRLGIVALHKEKLHLLLDCRSIFPPLTAITADDVSFDNSQCELPEVRTVQEAIDALCERPSGGEAVSCFTVGNAGRFQDLQQAVDVLLEEGLRTICLCLMPGEVMAVDKLTVQASPKDPIHLSIHGCAGSRLVLNQEWSVNGLASFDLRDLDLSVPAMVQANMFLAVQNTTQFSMTGCRLSAAAEKEAVLVGLFAVEQALLRDNHLSYIQARNIEIGRAVFRGLEPVQLFEPESGLFLDERAIRGAAASLSELDAGARKKLSDGVVRILRQSGNEITPREQIAYRAFSAALIDEGRHRLLLPDSLKAVLQAATAGQTALMIVDCAGDVTLSGNRFHGTVSLGGEPVPNPFPPDLLMKLVEQLKGRQIRLAPGGGRFTASGNVFTGLVWGREHWEMLEAMASTEDAVMENVYETVTLSDNHFDLGDNAFAGSWLTVTGNAFRERQTLVQLVAASQIGAFSGNAGVPIATRAQGNAYNYSSLTQQAANPGLTFISTA